MVKPKPTIFVDMDQVLADFDRAACDKLGVSVDEVNKIRTGDNWDLIPFITQITEEPYNIDKFWETLTPTPEEGEEFWLSIEPLPWMRELINVVDEHSANWYVVSSPQTCYSSHSGKIKWLRKHVHPEFNNFMLIPDKHLLAKKDRLLIDDKPSTITQFIVWGGEAILFPSHGNRSRVYMDNPLEPIEDYFKDIYGA